MERPSMNRSYVASFTVGQEPDAVTEWATATPAQRIAAALFLREATYGRDHVAARIPRVLEVLPAPWCTDDRESLIASKLFAGRPQDLADVEQLRRATRDGAQ